MARLILDTGVLIAGARGRIDVAELSDTDDVAVTAITVAEYRTGTVLDTDPGRAAAQRAVLDEILQILPVHEYGLDVAHHHAALLAHVRHTGSKTGAHDPMIAATARAADRIAANRANWDQRADIHAGSERTMCTASISPPGRWPTRAA